MRLLTIDPAQLQRNPWNSNHLTPDAEAKLYNSIERHGLFKPIIARELADGTLQILGGQHRADIAQTMGVQVPVFVLGGIDDTRAKEIGLADNARYGHDDAAELARIIESLGGATDLASFLPLDVVQIEALSAIEKIDLDTLGLEEEDAPAVEGKPAKAPKTHVTMRFRVPIENQALVERVVKKVIEEHGFDDSDAMVNAGDALVQLAIAYDEDRTHR